MVGTANEETDWRAVAFGFKRRLVDYYVEFSRQHAQDIPEAHACLDAEKDNLLGAAYQAFEGARPQAVCDLAANLGPRASRFLDTLAYHEDAQRLLKLAIEAAIQLRQSEKEAIFRLHLGLACERRNQFSAAQAEYDRALALARDGQLHDPVIEANSLVNLGRLALHRGETAAALNYMQPALPLARRSQDSSCLVTCLCNLGEAYQQRKQYRDARAVLDEALALARWANRRRQEGEALHALGNLCFVQQDWRGALNHYEAAFALIEASLNRPAKGTLYNNMGMAYHNLHDVVRARHHLEQARALLQSMDDRHSLGVINFNLALLYKDQGDLVAAGRLAREARDLFEGTPNETWAKQLLQQIETAIRLQQIRHDWP